MAVSIRDWCVSRYHQLETVLRRAGYRPTVTDLDIRTYEPRDADAVWSLHERALREAGAFDPELTHLDADLKRIESAYLGAGGTFLVGERGGAILAMGQCARLRVGRIVSRRYRWSTSATSKTPNGRLC